MIGILKRSAILHQTQCFAVTPGAGIPKLRRILSLVSRPFDEADDHHRTTIETGDTTDDSFIVCIARSPASSSNSSNARRT
ncbi:hypothetical protein ACLBOM_29560 [Escherichia coli]